MSRDVYICDAVRTPIGRFGGALAAVRADDLGAIPLKALLERNPQLDPAAIDDLYYGCANQAGEDNRNVARMALLLAGLPPSVPGVTLNRLCASGLDAVGSAFRAIASGEIELAIAGGVESMSRAPFVMGKADGAWSRNMKIEDTTMGWRFINPVAQGPVRRRGDAADRRQRGRGLWHLPRRPGRLRPAQPAARRSRPGRGFLRRGNRPGGDQGQEGRYRGG
jgi:3-oxoadipyl-CoA thiolase